MHQVSLGEGEPALGFAVLLFGVRLAYQDHGTLEPGPRIARDERADALARLDAIANGHLQVLELARGRSVDHELASRLPLTGHREHVVEGALAERHQAHGHRPAFAARLFLA